MAQCVELRFSLWWGSGVPSHCMNSLSMAVSHCEHSLPCAPQVTSERANSWIGLGDQANLVWVRVVMVDLLQEESQRCGW